MKIIFAFIILQFLFLNISAQEIEEIENWINPRDIPLRLEFKRYSREDSEIIRNKYLLLKEQSPLNEWEGEYFMEAGYVNQHILNWSSNLGFAEFNFYTCFPTLRYVNYGKVEHSSETVKFIPEFQKDSPRKSGSPTILIKVEWEDTHFLVPERYLGKFCESAAGLDIKKTEEEIQFPDFYTKTEDIEKELSGLPILPDSYKNFLRHPIETKILSLNKRFITSEKNEWNGETERKVNYNFTIAAGQKQGVKIGLSFYIPEIDEWFQITKVNAKTSSGSFVREADENGRDVCFDDKYEKTPCPKFSAGLETKTKYQPFYF